MSTLPQLAAAAQFILGIVFLLSSLPKLRHPRLFARSVVTYRILPKYAAPLLAGVVMLLELFLAVALLTGWENGIARPFAVLLLLGFLSAVGVNLSRGRQIRCGCFGEGSEMISPRTLARLALLLAAAAFVLAVCAATDSPVPGLVALVAHSAAPGEVLQVIALAGGFLLLGCWLLSLPEIIVVVRGLFRGILPSGGAGDEVEGT